MLKLILIIVCAIVWSVILDKTMDELLPPALMAAVLVVYGLMILGMTIKGASIVALGAFVMISAMALSLYYFRRHKLGNPLTISKKTINSFIFNKIITFPIIVCLITCIVFAILFSAHRLMHWDDLSYWGIYAKDLFILGRLPKGIENCSISYKDYTPIMQILECFFMNPAKGFNETRLFQINVCFMYIIMLPFLSGLNGNKTLPDQRNVTTVRTCRTIGAILLYLIFPHVFTTQFYFKLGVDYIMSILFGYGIWIIATDNGNEEGTASNWKRVLTSQKIYNLLRLIIVASFLGLVKSAGAVLVLFLAVFYALYNMEIKKKDTVKKTVKLVADFLSAFVIPILFALSWKLWSRRTGNFGYLSDKLDDNIRTGAHIFPSYTLSTTLDYIKHVLIYPLTREKIGITAAIMICTIAVIYHCRKRAGKITTADKRLHTAMCVGMVLFCIAHLYMYLFVFDEWEAAGLMEFDRYINQYFAGIFFYYLCGLWYTDCNVEGATASEDKSNVPIAKRFNLAVVITVLLIALLPYKVMITYLNPTNYLEYFDSQYGMAVKTAAEEWENCTLRKMNLPIDEDHRVMLIADAWSDEMQFFTVDMVPQPVTVVENIPALEEGKISEFCTDLIVSRGIDYIYVMENAKERYAGDFDIETQILTLDGEPLQGGMSYRVIRDGEMIALERL